MVFSSTLFLFLFLPAVLLLYAIAPRRLRNGVLLLASLLFYAWGEPRFVLVMLASILANYGLGLLVERTRGRASMRTVLGATVAVNIGLLVVFKYGGFLGRNVNELLSAVGGSPLRVPDIALPIGISFFTFQAMSYVIDVARADARVQRNPLEVALYISLFPQLIAGPIVRYRDIARQLDERRGSLAQFASGVERFVVGLAKKVLIANTVALPCDRIFALPSDRLTAPLAWLAVVCYTLQIYFDFSGYSDMAIGLGRMFGFEFLENFRFPYVADTIKEFWRRWHISLSTWFRDYLYIPIGGNRGSEPRTYANLVIVFFLCGLWHGAAWTFVAWGLFHGAFLVLERTRFGTLLEGLPRPARHVYAMLVVMVGWVLFRSETFAGALAMLTAMAGLAHPAGITDPARFYAGNDVVLAILAGIVGSGPVIPALDAALTRRLATRPNRLVAAGYTCVTLLMPTILLLASAVMLSAQTHNPFIYFRF